MDPNLLDEELTMDDFEKSINEGAEWVWAFEYLPEKAQKCKECGRDERYIIDDVGGMWSDMIMMEDGITLCFSCYEKKTQARSINQKLQACSDPPLIP